MEVTSSIREQAYPSNYQIFVKKISVKGEARRLAERQQRAFLAVMKLPAADQGAERLLGSLGDW